MHDMILSVIRRDKSFAGRADGSNVTDGSVHIARWLDDAATS